MGTYYYINEYELAIQPANEAIAALRAAIRGDLGSTPERPVYYPEDQWRAHRDAQNAIWQNWLDLPDEACIQAVVLGDGWEVHVENNIVVIDFTPSERKGGIDYDWLDSISLYVSGYIQIDREHEDTWRVVWKDGKKGRRVDPVWPEPSDDPEPSSEEE